MSSCVTLCGGLINPCAPDPLRELPFLPSPSPAVAVATQIHPLQPKIFQHPCQPSSHKLPDAVSIASVDYDGGGLQNSGYLIKMCKMENLDEAVQAVDLLHKQGIPVPEDIIFCLLQRCTQERHLQAGRQVLLLMISNGFDSVAIFGDHLIRLFATSGSLHEAYGVFCKVTQPSVYTWHAIISAYAMHGEINATFELYYKMQQEGIKPNQFIFTCILKACASMGAISQGILIHNDIVRSGLASDLFVGSALIDMYAKCKSLNQARKVFDDLHNRNVVSWNAMIAGYVQRGYGIPALELFEKMHQEGIKPDRITFLCSLKACSIIGSSRQGSLIHGLTVETGLELNIFVGSALVDMYAKSVGLIEACRIFYRLPNRDVVSWSAILAGYVQHGNGLAALELFDKMQEEGIKPDIVALSCALKACGSVGALEKGKLLHKQAIGSHVKVDGVLGSTLIDMYAKCGSLEEASKVLYEWPNLGVVSWGAMIAGYAQHGRFNLTRQTLECMQRQGLKPNGWIFTSILSACGHSGQVAEGHHYFKSMREEHGINPSIEHFGCMVDLLGRAGYFSEAEELLDIMPIRSDITGWMSLLTACRKHRKVELGRYCFDQVAKLDPSVAAGYVLMMHIYADAHMWESVHEIQELKKCANLWKKPGKAWIEVDMKVHEFIVGDRSHPQSDMIYANLNRLKKLMKEEGYVPDLGLVLEPDFMQEREDALCGHCEKLAIAFGLLNLPEGATIRVTKNLRMCTDCHNASKILSKIESRHIIISDEYRVHHFEDGLCSCGDYL